MPEETKKTILSLIEALNARDLARWSEQLTEDYIAEQPGLQSGLFSNVVLSQLLGPSGEVAGVERFDQAQYSFLGFLRHWIALSDSRPEWVDTSCTNQRLMLPNDDARIVLE